jgi:hypothetical protein
MSRRRSGGIAIEATSDERGFSIVYRRSWEDEQGSAHFPFAGGFRSETYPPAASPAFDREAALAKILKLARDRG